MTDADLRAEPNTTASPQASPQENPNGAHGRTRGIRKAATTVLAVAVGSVGLTWSAVALTQEGPDWSPVATSCAYTLSDPGKPVSLPPAEPPRSDRPYTVKMATNMGTIAFETLNANAPCATNSFVHLARSGYYGARTCPRLTTQNIFILECGAPAGKGSTDPGYFFKDENLSGATYQAGTVAMSKVVPGHNGSQFFISYGDPVLHMPEAWTPFATVVSGLDVLKKIAANGTEHGTSDGRPDEPVVIESVTVQ